MSEKFVSGMCVGCKIKGCTDLDPSELLCQMCWLSPAWVTKRAAKGAPMAENGTVVADGGGLRYNSGKLRYDLLPTDSTAELVKVLTYGANKYAARNWERGQKWSIPYASCLRHLQAWYAGEDNDPESGLSHLAHAACNIAFLLAYQARGMFSLDDREHLHKRDIRALSQ